MNWRDPRNPDDLVESTPQNLYELALAYHPILRFADDERFFPVLAESWLQHCTEAQWRQEDTEDDDLPVDPYQRGTAMMRSDIDVSHVQLLGGTPNADDRPIQLSSVATDPDSIGRFAGVGPDVFLDFGGWQPDGTRRKGDEDYLFRAFSELAGAMNPRNSWKLVEGDAHLPHLWIPQPVNPTVYAEAEWAGMYPRWNDQFGLSDFPPTGGLESDMDRYLSLTYYYLYPLRAPAAGEDSPRRLEGQWEAISLFFLGQASRERDADGRCRSFVFREPPEWVVVSRGLDRYLGKQLTLLRPWSMVERQHAHPVIYVASGTHRHYFEPVTGTSWAPGTTPVPGDDINPSVPDDPMASSVLLGWSVFAGGGGPGTSILLAIALFFLWLILLIQQLVNRASGDTVPTAPPSEDAGGDGAQAGGEEPPAGSPPPDGSVPAGTPNAGSPTGRDTVAFDVRLVDMLNGSQTHTDFPPNKPTDRPPYQLSEHPHWWEFSGSWGINVAPGVDNDWESGMQRVDASRRSWGFWNALQALTFLHGGGQGV